MIADFDNVSRHIYSRLSRELSPYLTYHSLFHTRDDVVPAATRLGLSAGLDSEGVLILATAAVFHDTGFLLSYDEHEQYSILIARDTLPAYGYSAGQVAAVVDLIGATRMPQTPKGLLQELMCDADLDLLGRDDFMHLNQLLLQETRHYMNKDMSDGAWFLGQSKFLENHHFFTRVADEFRSAGKVKNMAQIRIVLSSLNGSVSNIGH